MSSARIRQISETEAVVLSEMAPIEWDDVRLHLELEYACHCWENLCQSNVSQAAGEGLWELTCTLISLPRNFVVSSRRL